MTTQRKTPYNEPSADNAGGFRMLAFTKPINDKGKQKQEQVNPALRLPEGVSCYLNNRFLMRQFTYLIILNLTFISCIQRDVDKKVEIALDSLKREELKITIINDTNQTKYITDNYTSYWIPTLNQLRTIDSIIEKAIRDNGKDYYRHLKPTTFKNYYRQYVCYIENNGDSIAFINAFYDIDFRPMPGDSVKRSDDWQFYLIEVMDGGDRYWNITINLSKKKFFNFIVNGEA